MQINIETIDKLAQLARLNFDDTQKQSIANDVQRMVHFVEKLNELDTTGVEPLLHMSKNVNILRADEIQGSITVEEALKNAPQADANFFKVPKVISK
jgi:aspartyl-tRNA(Asn)/glutamyl-tRNA(Gln) amidotransferase subunit C